MIILNKFFIYDDNKLQCKRLNTTNLVEHFYSDSSNGVSIEKYEYIKNNCALPDEVEKKHNNFSMKNAVFLSQVHGDNFYVVDNYNKHDIRGKLGDALICIDKDIPIMIFTADCVPIFILDYVKGYIAAIHAGWKGTELKISNKVVRFMINTLNSNPGDLIASIGPSIGPCCYEVSEDVATKFSYYVKDDKFYINLWEENNKQLIEAGLSRDNIFISEVCTYCNKQFYSYRRDGISSGRQINVIQLKE